MKNIHLLAIIGVSAMLVIMSLSLSLAHGQITDSRSCVTSKTETPLRSIVKLQSSNCNIDTFNDTIKYYKSLGYNQTSYYKGGLSGEIITMEKVNSIEEASKNAKEILCNKYYELDYCEGQEANNKGTNSTTKLKPQSDCFTAGNFFDPYYGRIRCILK